MSGVPVDLSRAVPLRIVGEMPDHDPATPGDAMVTEHADGSVAGYIFACPGCGAQSVLTFHPRRDPVPAWTVTAGDPRTGAGLSLSPSIHHAAPRGCGWHGYLTGGVLRPC